MSAMIGLQEKFIEVLLASVRQAWHRIEIHYENCEWKGNVLEKYISNSILGNEKTELPLSLEMLDILSELKDVLPEGQAEKWTWLEFSLDTTGKYKFDYKYGLPPLAAKSIKFAE